MTQQLDSIKYPNAKMMRAMLNLWNLGSIKRGERDVYFTNNVGIRTVNAIIGRGWARATGRTVTGRLTCVHMTEEGTEWFSLYAHRYNWKEAD